MKELIKLGVDIIKDDIKIMETKHLEDFTALYQIEEFIRNFPEAMIKYIA